MESDPNLFFSILIVIIALFAYSIGSVSAQFAMSSAYHKTNISGIFSDIKIPCGQLFLSS